MRREKTFIETYNYFEPGTFVTPTSRRCVLVAGRVYKVVRCHEPLYAGDEAVVFVEGHRSGIRTEYLREATSGEIKRGDWEVEW